MAAVPEDYPVVRNDAILKAARGEKPHRIPIWIMRQAGRYLPEFQEVRKNHDFFELVRNPELAAEVTMQPIKRYDLDAAIIFSDILVIPQALGMEVQMKPGVGPVFTNPLQSPTDFDSLRFNADIAKEMKGTLEAITLTRRMLDGKVPLLGFCGAPWTLLSYMIEGSGSRTCQKAKSWLYKYPLECDRVLYHIADFAAQYLVLQVKAGAQMLQVFESHAEHLSPELFQSFSLPYVSIIVKETKRRLKKEGLSPVPMVIFAKGGHFGIKQLSMTDYDVVGIDWTVDPEVARTLAKSGTVLQGNLDPVALFGDPDSIEANATAMIKKFGPSNYICNLGHGIYPETPVEAVQELIDAVHAYPV